MPIPAFLLKFLAMPLIKRFGKPFLIALVIGGAIWLAHTKFEDYKEGLIQQGFEDGYSKAGEDMSERIEKSREENIALETEIENITNKYFTLQEENDTLRKRNEQSAADRISHRMVEISPDNKEQCALPADVVDDRNAIRALGPKVR